MLALWAGLLSSVCSFSKLDFFPPKFSKIIYTPPIAECEPAIFAALCSRRANYFIFNGGNVGAVGSLRLIDPAAEFFLLINPGVFLCYRSSARLLHIQQKS